MKKILHILTGSVCALLLLAMQTKANAVEDSRITYYKNEVHLTADQLRARAKDLEAWQKNNWVAPRACNGSMLTWAKTPPGKSNTLYDCSPFQCSGEGVCRHECAADSDCASGAKCLDRDASGRNGVCAAP